MSWVQIFFCPVRLNGAKYEVSYMTIRTVSLTELNAKEIGTLDNEASIDTLNNIRDRLGY